MGDGADNDDNGNDNDDNDNRSADNDSDDIKGSRLDRLRHWYTVQHYIQ